MSDLPRRKPLTQDEVYQLLRECVTVVRPGEALVVRMADLTPAQLREWQQALDAWHEDGKLPFRVFVFIGDELGVMKAGETVVRHEVAPLTDAEFAKQLYRVMEYGRKTSPGSIA